jgi:hypothetical protein
MIHTLDIRATLAGATPDQIVAFLTRWGADSCAEDGQPPNEPTRLATMLKADPTACRGVAESASTYMEQGIECGSEFPLGAEDYDGDGLPAPYVRIDGIIDDILRRPTTDGESRVTATRKAASLLAMIHPTCPEAMRAIAAELKPDETAETGSTPKYNDPHLKMLGTVLRRAADECTQPLSLESARALESTLGL